MICKKCGAFILCKSCWGTGKIGKDSFSEYCCGKSRTSNYCPDCGRTLLYSTESKCRNCNGAGIVLHVCKIE